MASKYVSVNGELYLRADEQTTVKRIIEYYKRNTSLIHDLYEKSKEGDRTFGQELRLEITHILSELVPLQRDPTQSSLGHILRSVIRDSMHYINWGEVEKQARKAMEEDYGKED